ncbi:alpha/beta hydrolase [Dyadobacter chenwenxiniae]|uniref:Alpha/beta hydrolase n=1 Tax=Dyadobacter chenwenxiniae TaxID=2906456 RepID=A0A9X1PPW5_9BACT|nr:alpha/beta hydrolase [Dyadobacter chenwenxiniae]MCF0064249.1 alpha/beta hydrolase [Dyadobacter chenwenxiniae]UON82538.1 alpha/beta hydrolase [Dyadobacter chenwenxiniae]
MLSNINIPWICLTIYLTVRSAEIFGQSTINGANRPLEKSFAANQENDHTLSDGTATTHERSSTPDPDKMNLYFLSGLGADKRVFSKLVLDERFAVHYIDWIKPEKKETIAHYASRLVAQIDTTRPFQLVGLSFGGIVASELANIVHPEQIVIISSTPTGVPISKFYQGLTKFLLLSPFAAPFLKSTNTFTYKFFGADTPELKALLKSILHDTDSKFLKWALVRMGTWKRTDNLENLYHIHGTADKLIPIKMVKPDVSIDGAGHLMVYAQAKQISDILNKKLSDNWVKNPNH